jgi:CRISPR-associated protein Cas1
VLYYAGTKERVRVPFDDALRTRTFEAVKQVRDLSARDAPPEPLPAELRHRCFGCSLAPVCLPEETLYQIGPPAAATAAPPAAVTRVIPQSDDGAVLYLQEPGSHVGKRSEHLIVRKDGQELARVPMHAVRQVVVFGNVQVSTQALETLAANDILVAYLTGHGRFVGAFAPAMPKNVGLREAQYRRFADPAECLTLSKAVVRAKLSNQRTLLMRSLRCDGDRGSSEPAAYGLAEVIRRLEHATTVETVLGLEGQGAALYFGEFGRFLRSRPPGRGFDFTTRNRRPPRDPVNALLSFAYALLTKDCFAAACAVGFDPYKGFFHGNRHGKPSLALDLLEEFRPVIADSVVLTLLNNEMLTPGDFLVWREACQLTETGRKAFFAAYEQRKSTVITHPVYGYKMSYARMLEVQARMLAAYVRGSVPAYAGFTVR